MALEFLVQPHADPVRQAEVPTVRAIAESLAAALARPEATAALSAIPPIGGTSHAVDAIVAPIARSLGFTSQRRDLFAAYPTRLRPDWYRPLSDARDAGILLEIERGKALTNNMDLLDLWKCHICHAAHHLLLVVPFQVRRTSTTEQVYTRVATRLRTFVEPHNRVNVTTIGVIGY